jgi:hypothetical protein
MADLVSNPTLDLLLELEQLSGLRKPVLRPDDPGRIYNNA